MVIGSHLFQSTGFGMIVLTGGINGVMPGKYSKIFNVHLARQMSQRRMAQRMKWQALQTLAHSRIGLILTVAYK